MAKHRNDPTYHENLFRPLYELKSSYVWFAASGFSLYQGLSTDGVGQSLSMVSALVCASMSVLRVKQMYPMLTRQMKLLTNKLEFMDITDLRVLNKSHINQRQEGDEDDSGNLVIHKEDDRKTYLCHGFEWGPEHANRAYQVLDMSSDKSEIKLPFFLNSWKKRMLIETRKMGGKPWIHGMGDPVPIMVTEDGWFGHTFVAGNVGTGKTTLLRLLSLSMYHLGHVLVIVDPKNDADWRRSIQKEMEANGEGDKFYYFNPSNPKISCRIDPLKNFNRHTEITTRVASLQATEGGATSFSEFGWEVINKVVEMCLFIGESPRLTSMSYYLTSGKIKIATQCIRKHFDNVLDDKNWQVTRSAELARHGKSEIEQLIGYYNEVVADTHPHNAVYGAISLVTHDVSHYQKMVVGLLPLFSILNASPLDELISPRNNDEDEIIGGGCETGHIGAELKTPIIDTKKIIEEGGVLYMSLDSLSDSKTAGHLAKLILSDMAAVAGDRYNHEGNKRRVSIFVDEVHAAVAGNDALINLLAQGRAAQMQCFLATQTIPDLEDKTSPAAAERFVGLCNNFISMRVNDERTQEYVTRNFGKSGIIQQKVMMSQNASTDASIDDFSGSYAETLSKIESDSFPAQLLTDMPKLQFIGRLADGRKIKGRLKIITE